MSINQKTDDLEMFTNLCKHNKEWILKKIEQDATESSMMTHITRQKNAIMGNEEDVAFYKIMITDFVEKKNMANMWYPPWYKSLIDAIFHENWGFSGLAEFFESDLEVIKQSSSAKIIGGRVFFLLNGKMTEMPQIITKERRKQLKTALLLNAPIQKLNEDIHEIFRLDGARITIIGDVERDCRFGGLTKENEDVIVIRKYVMQDYTFEALVKYGTIPKGSDMFFKQMIDIGYNVAFTGKVRSGKTTFLNTWQKYERDDLEGVMIETDPEINMSMIKPFSPVIQLVADGDKLGTLMKHIMRTDADYIVVSEARDGNAYSIAVEAANRGTRRVKLCCHTTPNKTDFVKFIAEKISISKGISFDICIENVARSFDFVFHFIEIQGSKVKKLKSIKEIQYSKESGYHYNEICIYDSIADDWTWKGELGHDKREVAIEESLGVWTDLNLEFERLKRRI